MSGAVSDRRVKAPGISSAGEGHVCSAGDVQAATHSAARVMAHRAVVVILSRCITDFFKMKQSEVSAVDGDG